MAAERRTAGEPRLRLVSAPAGLTPEQHEAVETARRLMRPIRRAAGVAAFGGWTSAIFAVLSLPFALGGGVALAAPVVLGLVAFNEFRGGALVRRLDGRGPLVLGLNQVFFGVCLCAYAGWQLWKGPSAALTAAASSGDPQVDALVAGLARTVHLSVYGGVLACGVLVPGLTGLYYLTRAGALRRARAGAPEWALRLAAR